MSIHNIQEKIMGIRLGHNQSHQMGESEERTIFTWIHAGEDILTHTTISRIHGSKTPGEGLETTIQWGGWISMTHLTYTHKQIYTFFKVL